MKLNWFRQIRLLRKKSTNTAGAVRPLLTLALILVLSVAATPVWAAPQMPFQLYGSVMVNNQEAPIGTPVIAIIKGMQFVSTVTDAEGKYGYAPAFFRIPADDPGTMAIEGGANGDTVQLLIGNVVASTTPFSSGSITNVNLAVDLDETVEPTIRIPNAPISLTVSAPAYNQIVLAWGDNSIEEDGFHIARSTDGSSYDLIATLDANSTTYTDTSVVDSILYYYLVTAFNSAGDSYLAGPVTISALSLPLPPSPSPTQVPVPTQLPITTVVIPAPAPQQLPTSSSVPVPALVPTTLLPITSSLVPLPVTSVPAPGQTSVPVKEPGSNSVITSTQASEAVQAPVSITSTTAPGLTSSPAPTPMVVIMMPTPTGTPVTVLGITFPSLDNLVGNLALGGIIGIIILTLVVIFAVISNSSRKRHDH